MKKVRLASAVLSLSAISFCAASMVSAQQYSSAIRPPAEASASGNQSDAPVTQASPTPSAAKPKSTAASTGKPTAKARQSTGGSYFEPYETKNTLNIPDGDIVIDIEKRRLFYSLGSDVVMVYPVAVGRQGAVWRGKATIERMVDGPTWFPTAEQRSKKKLPQRVGPGPGNPLGSHALYLFQGGKDTLIRIHGTNNPSSIGKAVSDGCFRMRNEHIEELYGYVQLGARVTVR